MKFVFGIIIFILLEIPCLKAEVNRHTLAILVNENDPESIEIAKYYQQQRLIADSNVIYINIKENSSSLTIEEFKKIEIQLKEKVPQNIQAFALAWRKPWRVACMSITAAFSLGFSKEYCAKECRPTKRVKYYNSLSSSPYTDFKIRPSMLLTGKSVKQVKQLIDRGVSADYARPIGTAYLLSTSDKQRNVRAAGFSLTKKTLNRLVDIDILNVDAIKNKTDIMFYFTGLKKVKWVNRNKYLPGAIGDHLTSLGGHLFKSTQMSILEWISAGVTGTYGTVVEPCNFVQKFPSPRIVMQKYLTGETLLEAYWKSVVMPGQGLFVGEPLAAPYKKCQFNLYENKIYVYSKNKSENFVMKNAKNCYL